MISRCHRIIFALCLAVGAALLCARHGMSEPLYSGGPTMPVVSPEIVTLHDASRDKDLAVTAVFPKAGGPYPVIVFSHVWGGKPDAYTRLISFWAAHGYVVLAPAHADAGDITNLGAMKDETEDPAAWEGRVRDVTFVADALPTLQRRLPALKGKMDRSRIAAGGHSYGAYVSQLIAGATVDIPNGRQEMSFRDKRFRAALLLSPQGVNRMGLTARSWDHAAIPMMTMTGSRDRAYGDVGTESRLDPYKHAPAGNKYLVYFDGATHFTFCDVASKQEERRPGIAAMRARNGMTQTQMYSCVEVVSLAFWDAYLKDNREARSYLHTSDLAGGLIHMSAK